MFAQFWSAVDDAVSDRTGIWKPLPLKRANQQFSSFLDVGNASVFLESQFIVDLKPSFAVPTSDLLRCS